MCTHITCNTFVHIFNANYHDINRLFVPTFPDYRSNLKITSSCMDLLSFLDKRNIAFKESRFSDDSWPHALYISLSTLKSLRLWACKRPLTKYRMNENDTQARNRKIVIALLLQLTIWAIQWSVLCDLIQFKTSTCWLNTKYVKC
jgi:hypothetical protein